jgi:hypothetical protein
VARGLPAARRRPERMSNNPAQKLPNAEIKFP